MMTLVLLLFMQHVISVKAGLVNYVEGNTSVRPQMQVEVGYPIKTAANSRVEALLNPGSFLRVDENSEVVIENDDLMAVALRVVAGTVLIEAAEIGKKNPIQVTVADTVVRIIQPGLYSFSADSATVLDGKLELVEKKMVVKKGWQWADRGTYVERVHLPGKLAETYFDGWSRSRSQKLAYANVVANRYSERSRMRDAFWVFSPFVQCYIFMPRGNYRSPYGYAYFTPRQNSNDGFNGNTGSVASGNSGGSPAGASSVIGGGSGGPYAPNGVAGGVAGGAPKPKPLP